MTGRGRSGEPSAGLDATRAVWDGHAPTYDDEPDHGLRDPVVRQAWAELLLPLVGPPPRRVVEMGCGTGSLVALLAEAGHRVTGLELSPAMLRLAAAKLATLAERTTLVEADVHDPPLDGPFDVVLCRHVLWTLDDPVAVLRRWLRLLADDGRLLLVEGSWHTGAGLSAADVVALLDEAGATAEVHPLTDPTLWGGPTGDERYVAVATRA